MYHAELVTLHIIAIDATKGKFAGQNFKLLNPQSILVFKKKKKGISVVAPCTQHIQPGAAPSSMQVRALVIWGGLA